MHYRRARSAAEQHEQRLWPSKIATTKKIMTKLWTTEQDCESYLSLERCSQLLCCCLTVRRGASANELSVVAPQWMGSFTFETSQFLSHLSISILLIQVYTHTLTNIVIVLVFSSFASGEISRTTFIAAKHALNSVCVGVAVFAYASV